MPWNKDGSRKDPSAYKMKGHAQPGPFQRKSPLKQKEELEPLPNPERHPITTSKKQGIVNESGAKLKWSEDTQQWTNTSTGEVFSSEEIKTALKSPDWTKYRDTP